MESFCEPPGVCIPSLKTTVLEGPDQYSPASLVLFSNSASVLPTGCQLPIPGLFYPLSGASGSRECLATSDECWVAVLGSCVATAGFPFDLEDRLLPLLKKPSVFISDPQTLRNEYHGRPFITSLSLQESKRAKE